jgi:hypothetical protein
MRLIVNRGGQLFGDSVIPASARRPLSLQFQLGARASFLMLVRSPLYDQVQQHANRGYHLHDQPTWPVAIIDDQLAKLDRIAGSFERRRSQTRPPTDRELLLPMGPAPG